MRDEDGGVRRRGLTSAGQELLDRRDGLRPQRTHPPFVSFPVQPYPESCEVQMLDTQVGDFLHPGAGVVEKQQEEAIARGVRPLRGQPVKECDDVRTLQETRLWWGDPLDRNRGHLLTHRQSIGGTAGEILEEACEHGPPMIARAHVVVSFHLQ